MRRKKMTSRATMRRMQMRRVAKLMKKERRMLEKGKTKTWMMKMKMRRWVMLKLQAVNTARRAKAEPTRSTRLRIRSRMSRRTEIQKDGQVLQPLASQLSAWQTNKWGMWWTKETRQMRKSQQKRQPERRLIQRQEWRMKKKHQKVVMVTALMTSASVPWSVAWTVHRRRHHRAHRPVMMMKMVAFLWRLELCLKFGLNSPKQTLDDGWHQDQDMILHRTYPLWRISYKTRDISNRQRLAGSNHHWPNWRRPREKVRILELLERKERMQRMMSYQSRSTVAEQRVGDTWSMLYGSGDVWDVASSKKNPSVRTWTNKIVILPCTARIYA